MKKYEIQSNTDEMWHKPMVAAGAVLGVFGSGDRPSGFLSDRKYTK